MPEELLPADADLAADPDLAGESGAEATDASDASDASDPFEDVVYRTLDSLPGAFRERLGSVAIVIEDEPSPDQLTSVHAYGLLGLYTGVPRTTYGAENAIAASKIVIFRYPHIRQYGLGPALEAGIADTVRHEIAHHFGISDDRLHELERERHGHSRGG
jgi:predicted Zn-dependent protease with MMP-like domain